MLLCGLTFIPVGDVCTIDDYAVKLSLRVGCFFVSGIIKASVARLPDKLLLFLLWKCDVLLNMPSVACFRLDPILVDF